MKKKVLIGAMMCWMALSAQAQFQYDRALPMPTYTKRTAFYGKFQTYYAI